MADGKNFFYAQGEDLNLYKLHKQLNNFRINILDFRLSFQAGRTFCFERL
jgi:hypothetical protein